MADVRVSSEAVDNASARVSAMVDEFTSRHALCDQTVAGLVSGPWTGAAASSFHEGWGTWSAGAAKVGEALAGIATLLAEAAAEYAETEGRVTRVSQSSSVASAPTVVSPPATSGAGS